MYVLFSLELLFILFQKEKIAVYFNTLGLLISFSGLLFIVFETKRPPLFGSFEAGVYIVFILSLLAKVCPKKIFLVNSIAVLSVLSLQFGQYAVNDDYYMYDNLWVILFFNLRLLSAAFFVHAMVLHLTCLFKGSDNNSSLLRYARYHSLIAVFIYLCSEWSGSFWCLNWFGDSWRWSNGFLKASILFLLVMAGAHLPVNLGRNRLVKAVLGSLPGCFILWMIFYH